MTEKLADLGKKFGDELLEHADEDEVADIVDAIRLMRASNASVATACASVMAELIIESPREMQRGAYAAIHTIIDSFLEDVDDGVTVQ